MMWSTYDDDQHRDFEHDPGEFEQKLKGPVSFSLDVDGPPKIDLSVEVKKKKGFVYKIKEKIINVKGNTRELF
jgi:hypothetical protein